MDRSVPGPAFSRLTILLSTSIALAALYLGREVLVPLALAVLFGFLMAPVVSFLERMKLPRIAATLLVVGIGVGGIGGVAYVVGMQVGTIIKQFPTYEEQLRAKVRNMSPDGLISRMEEEAKAVTAETATTRHSDAPVSGGTPTGSRMPTSSETPIPVKVVPDTPTPWGLVRDYSGVLLGPLGTAAIVLVFVIFVLIDREDLRDRVIRLGGQGRVHLTTQALDEASVRISRYLGALAIVNAGFALVTALGLWLVAKLLGQGHTFPNVLVWGIFVGLLRFVPYVGIWIGAGIPILLSFALFPGYGVLIGVFVMFIVVECLISQFVEPFWYGSSTGMSPLAYLVAAVFWGWLWGPIGLFMATPLTVILVVIGKYVPQLKFLDILLREEPVLSPPVKFYQRLLAFNQKDAAAIAREYLNEKKSLEAVFDDLLIRALLAVESDFRREFVGQAQLHQVRQSVRDLIDTLADIWKGMTDVPVKSPAIETSASSKIGGPGYAEGNRNHLPDGCILNVLCLPAGDEPDEIVSLMFARTLESRGYGVKILTAASLATEMVQVASEMSADLVCVSAMPPAAIVHARYLSKRLRAKFPEIPILVGLWMRHGNLTRAKERIGISPYTHVAANLRDAHQATQTLMEPLVQKGFLAATVE